MEIAADSRGDEREEGRGGGEERREEGRKQREDVLTLTFLTAKNVYSLLPTTNKHHITHIHYRLHMQSTALLVISTRTWRKP
jgi:hypothetical protein